MADLPTKNEKRASLLQCHPAVTLQRLGFQIASLLSSQVTTVSLSKLCWLFRQAWCSKLRAYASFERGCDEVGNVPCTCSFSVIVKHTLHVHFVHVHVVKKPNYIFVVTLQWHCTYCTSSAVSCGLGSTCTCTCTVGQYHLIDHVTFKAFQIQLRFQLSHWVSLGVQVGLSYCLSCWQAFFCQFQNLRDVFSCIHM